MLWWFCIVNQMVTMFFIRIFERNLFMEILCSSFGSFVWKDTIYENIMGGFYCKMSFIFLSARYIQTPFLQVGYFLFKKSKGHFSIIHKYTPNLQLWFCVFKRFNAPFSVFFIILGIAFGKNASFWIKFASKNTQKSSKSLCF